MGSRGKLIQSIEIKTNTKELRNNQVSFYADKSGNGQIQFIVESGDWYFSNISLTALKETGFSPGSAEFIIPINDWQRNDKISFKAEFYNQKGDRADVFATSSEESFIGSNTYIQGSDNLLSGSLYIGNVVGHGIEISGKNSAYLRSIGYSGWPNANAGNGSGFMMWSVSVLPIDAPGFYDGVGIELHGGSGSAINPNTGKGETHALRYNTTTGRLEITGSIYATDGYFSGSIEANRILVPFGGAADGNFTYEGVKYRAAITPEGYAHFQSASVGGWVVTPSTLRSHDGLLTLYGSGSASPQIYLSTEGDGELFIHYHNENSWGLSGINNDAVIVFRLGSTNQIAGWYFSDTQLTSSNIIIDSNGSIQTADFQTGLRGWQITSAHNGYAEFENAKIRGTLSTTVFEKETINAVGGQLWVANSTVLSGSGASDTATTWSVENASGWAVDEVAIVKKVTDTGFTTEYVRIMSSSLDTSSTTKYNGKIYVERNYDGGLDWYFDQLKTPDTASLIGDSGSASGIEYEVGQTIVSTGLSGSGYIRLNANPRDQYTPYIDIIERTGSGIYDVRLRARIGDLSGLNPSLLFGDESPGHGIYTENGFFQGTVTATTGAFTGKVHAGNLLIGQNVNGANDGIYINSNNYWYDTGNFSIGNATNNVVWNGSALKISGSLYSNATIQGGMIKGADISTSDNDNKIRINPSNNTLEFYSAGSLYSYMTFYTDAVAIFNQGSRLYGKLYIDELASTFSATSNNWWIDTTNGLALRHGLGGGDQEYIQLDYDGNISWYSDNILSYNFSLTPSSDGLRLSTDFIPSGLNSLGGSSNRWDTIYCNTINSTNIPVSSKYLHFGRDATLSAFSTTTTVDAYTINGAANGQGYRILDAGKITGISCQLDCDDSSAPPAGLTVKAQINGSNTGLQTFVACQSTGDLGGYTNTTGSEITFSAGDRLNVEMSLYEAGVSTVNISNIAILVEIET